MSSTTYKLYLDDVRTPTDPSWIVVRSYEEFVAKIRLIGLKNIELISLDHDLGEQAMKEFYNNVINNYRVDYNNIQEKTGYDAAKWLVDHSVATNVRMPRVLVHSFNPIGAANIMGYINTHLLNCRLPQNCVRHIVDHT